MITNSKKPRGLTLTSVLWMTAFFFVASAPYGTHAQQQNPAKAGTFGYVTNRFDNSISVIDTAKNTVVDTIPVGGDASGVAITPNGTLAYVANLASITENAVSVIKIQSPIGCPRGLQQDRLIDGLDYRCSGNRRIGRVLEREIKNSSLAIGPDSRTAFCGSRELYGGRRKGL